MKTRAFQIGIVLGVLALAVLSAAWWDALSEAPTEARDTPSAHARDVDSRDAWATTLHPPLANAARVELASDAASLASPPGVRVIDPDDQPVAGCRVRLVWQQIAFWRNAEAITDDQGMARAPWLTAPAPVVQVEAHATGWPVVASRWDPSAAVTLRLVRGVELHGRVVDRAQGDALIGALVAWQLADDMLADQYRETVRTTSEGAFTLTIPMGRACCVDAFESTHDAVRVEIPPLASETDARSWSPTLTLTQSPRRQLAVTGPDGKPITSIETSTDLLAPRTKDGIATGEAAGAFALHWPANTDQLFVWSDGLGPGVIDHVSAKASQPIQLAATQILVVDVDVGDDVPHDLPFTLEMQVVRASAPRYVRDSWQLLPESFPFELPIANDWDTVDLELNGVAIEPTRSTITRREWPDNASRLKHMLAVHAVNVRLRVLVQDADRHAITNAMLIIDDRDSATRHYAHTDQSGRASVPLHQRCAIAVTASGHVGAAFESPSIATGEEAVVTLVPSATVTGRCIDEQGLAIEDAAILVQLNGIARRYPENVTIGTSTVVANVSFDDESARGDWPIRARADRDGRFTIDGVPAGSSTSLTIGDERHFLPEPVIAPAGARDVELRALTMAPVVFRFPKAPGGGYDVVEIHWSPTESDPNEHYEVFRQRIGTVIERGAANALSGMLAPGSYQVTWSIDHVQRQGLESVQVAANRLTLIDVQ